MVKRKKHSFHCQKCGSECTIYKKGKAHRVLVCPECGVIATNPTVLGKVLKRAGKAVIGEIPGASLVMEGLGLASDLTKKEKASSPTPRARRQDNIMYYIEKAEHMR